MLLSLSSHPDFDKILEKYIPTKDLPTIRDTVFTLKTKVRQCLFLCVVITLGVLLKDTLSSYLEIWVYFRVSVVCLSQPGADAPSQAVAQSGPHLSPGSLSTRPTGGCEYQTVELLNTKFSLLCITVAFKIRMIHIIM